MVYSFLYIIYGMRKIILYLLILFPICIILQMESLLKA